MAVFKKRKRFIHISQLEIRQRHRLNAQRQVSDKQNALPLCGTRQPRSLIIVPQGRAFDLAIPTPRTLFALLYALALKEEDEKTLFNDTTVCRFSYNDLIKIG
jgi:hypothetical protein